MRNLKRALSLALASVMLLGMMVVGSSAAFSDADEIVNKEAVEITAGLGLFAGSDGKFDPKGTVTRAQMAAVIAKMFYGSDLNADTYKGGNQFNDTAAFEGGWAEGYINLGVEKGWFKGYGDGSFRPGQAVTTAEAVTMLLNLLKVDAGAGTWPMTVMAAAEDVELFDLECELKPAPATNVAMTRDQLAVVVWNALNYSAEGIKGYSFKDVKIVFDTWADASAYATKWSQSNNNAAWSHNDIQPIKNDTLAKTVFEIQTAVGYVTANQATGADYTLAAGKALNLETGLDMLGHYVKVYYNETYKTEKDPGEAYAIVDLAEYVTVADYIGDFTANPVVGDKKDYMAAFGGKVEMANNGNLWVFDGTGTWAGTQAFGANYSDANFYAIPGTYAVEIESGKLIGYLAPIDVELDQVSRVTTTAGKESIRLSNDLLDNKEDDDEVFEYAGIAEDDIVLKKTYIDGDGNLVYYLEKAEVVSGKITKKGTVDGNAATYIDGKAYVNDSFVTLANNNLVLAQIPAPDANKTYDAYLYNGKLIGVVQTSSAADLSEVVYVVDSYTSTTAGNYGTDSDYYYAQGVNAAGEEVTVLIGIENVVEANSQTHSVVTSLNPGFYTFEKSTDKEQAKKDIMVATPAKAENRFDEKVDEFFAEAVTGTQNANELKKDDKYVTIAAGRVYLTADTKFIVVEDNQGVTEELEIATYTGAIAKDITNDTLTVAAVEDENGNYLASIVVVFAAQLDLNTEDYIFISAVNSADAGVVEGNNKEVQVYFSATNEFKTIVADIATAGFYTNYTIDEDGVYELTGKAVAQNSYVKLSEEFAGIFGTAITSSDIDLYNAADAKIVDVRDAEWVEDKSEVATIETLKDIQSALKADYKVFFEAIVNPDGVEDVVTHIFVYSVKAEDTDAQGNGLGTWSEA